MEKGRWLARTAQHWRVALWLAGIAVLYVTACTKTVKWQEDVLLNTGQTLIVEQIARFEIPGGGGNPFDLGMRETGRKLKFKWGGKSYLFDLPIFAMVLAISPTGQPVVLAQAASGSWDAVHGYKCTLPYYVQFAFDENRGEWIWPSSIEPWTHNLPANLFRDSELAEKLTRRITPEDLVTQGFMKNRRSVAMQKIDPTYTGDLCEGKMIDKRK